MKLKIIFAGLCACLVAGCADKEKIVFSNESIARPAKTNVVAALPQGLDKTDELRIRVRVFEYLLSRHFQDDGDYATIFIQGNEAEVKALQDKFRDHLPPIKPANRAELRKGRTPRDLDTGKPAMVLSVAAGEPDADGSVDALGKWFAGDAVTGFYTFKLKKHGTDWEIESVK